MILPSSALGSTSNLGIHQVASSSLLLWRSTTRGGGAHHDLHDWALGMATTDAVPTTPASVAASLALNLVVAAIARGGAERFAPPTTAALDMGRVRMRLEGLQLYATLTALLTNGCLRLYSSIKASKSESDSSRWETIALDLFYICTAVSILSGSYTTIVFGLLSLYCKTALGRGLDQPFLEFWAATTDIRESALESFLYTLVSFELAFILSLVLRFRGRRRKLLVSLACVMSLMSFRRWTQIMILASKHLFPIRAEAQF